MMTATAASAATASEANGGASGVGCGLGSGTEKDELQDEEHLKRIAPPSTANTVGAIELIFGLEIHRVNINGATVAIFEFPS